jgi:predicted amidohydrolase
VLPEAWSVGYGGADQAAAFAQGDGAAAALGGLLAWSQPQSGPYVAALRRVAREEGIAICATFLEGTPPLEAAAAGAAIEPPRNSVAVVDRLGDVVLHYAKVHLAMGRWRAERGAPLSPEALMSPGRRFGTGVRRLPLDTPPPRPGGSPCAGSMNPT